MIMLIVILLIVVLPFTIFYAIASSDPSACAFTITGVIICQLLDSACGTTVFFLIVGSIFAWCLYVIGQFCYDAYKNYKKGKKWFDIC